MVGPLPRQAEGRDVHAAAEDPGRDHVAGATPGDRGDLERPRPGRGRAEHASERAAAFHRARRASRRLRSHARCRVDVGRCVRRHRPEHHRVPGRRVGARRALRRDADPRGGCRALLRESRLLRPAAQAQDRDHLVRRRLRRAGDQLRRLDRRPPQRRRGLRRVGRRRPLVGSAHRTGARDWVPKDEAVAVLAAILDEWKEDLRYRISRVKARLKFMVDDIGPGRACASASSSASDGPSTTSACRTCLRPATTSACTSRPTGGSTSACRCTSA